MSANYEQSEYVEKRIRYFFGQFLTEQDFIDEQKYHLDRQRRSNRILQVSGICEGLTVRTQELAKAVLDPGTALDPKGRLVVLSTSQNIDLEKYKEKGVNLVISYQEKESDLAELGKEDNGRWHEQPKIDLLSDTEDLPEAAILLAKLKVDPDGTVTIDNSVRQYSGIYLPSGNDSSGERTGPILRSGGESNSNLAILTGDLTVTGNLNTGNFSPENIAIGGNLSANGSFGIGTTSPEKKLHVEGGELKIKASHNNTTADIAAFLANNESQGIGIGYNRIEAIGSNAEVNIEMHPKGTGQVKVFGDLVVGSDKNTSLGNTNITGALGFGAAVRQMINLWNTDYGIGIQAGTQYFRTGKNFAWYKNGSHNNGELNPGGGTVQMVINNDNVGIGTASPTAKLQVSGGKIQLDGNQQIIFTNTDVTNNPKLQLWGGYGLGINGATLFYAANGRHSWRGNAGADEYMALTTSENGGLTVLGKGNSSFAGNVGIGKNNPTEKLEVAGNIKASGSMIADSAALVNASITGTLSFSKVTRSMINLWDANYSIGIQAGTQYFRTGKNFAWYKNGSHNNGELNPGGGTVQMVINNDNVGIGTASPGAKLDVNGIIRAYNKDNAGAPWDNIQIWADGISGYIQSNGDEEGLKIKSNTGGKIILENETIELPNIPRGWSGTDYLVWDRATKTIKHGTASSLRYKEDIQPLQEDFLKILQLESKSFSYKGTKQRSFGFLAEDLHSLGFQNLVSYDEEGLPEGISYPMLSVYLLEAMKRQNTQIEQLKMELDKLKK